MSRSTAVKRAGGSERKLPHRRRRGAASRQIIKGGTEPREKEKRKVPHGLHRALMERPPWASNLYKPLLRWWGQAQEAGNSTKRFWGGATNKIRTRGRDRGTAGLVPENHEPRTVTGGERGTPKQQLSVKELWETSQRLLRWAQEDGERP